jgi:pantoate--beta-alanine ligase
MGYLHQGHLSLFEWARGNAQKVATSIFVNPIQFGPNEDLDRYPRDPEGDAAKARAAGVDVLFMPEANDLYPEGFATTVRVTGLTGGLCGRSRPGHFDGVATVVAKLLLLSMPRVAVFGQKDWQQLAVIRRMVRDLDIPVAIEGRPIHREPDGLAMSSRNVYLSPAERVQAPAIRQGLLQAREAAQSEKSGPAGEMSASKLLADLAGFYAQTMPGAQVDYLECVHPETLAPVKTITAPTLLAVAVKFPGARLIDNILVREKRRGEGV